MIGVQNGTVSVPIPTKKGTYRAYYFTDGGYHWYFIHSVFLYFLFYFHVEFNLGAVKQKRLLLTAPFSLFIGNKNFTF